MVQSKFKEKIAPETAEKCITDRLEIHDDTIRHVNFDHTVLYTKGAIDVMMGHGHCALPIAPWALGHGPWRSCTVPTTEGTGTVIKF